MENILNQLIARHENLGHLKEPIRKAAELLIETYRNGGKVLVCGNGGSSADAGHIVGELMKSFEAKRPLQTEVQQKLKTQFGDRGILLSEKLQQGLPAISLSEHTSLITAISNDLGGDFIFAQQVAGYGNPGDVLLALSTSGNAQNVMDALIVARAKGLKTIGMTGETGGQMKTFCDVLINVPETRTAYVQELHLPIYHAFCMMVEKEMFD
ncbi:MAG TPA: SIS domain-containing protein [Mariniphaga anaerophila]|uniref:SIS domain-containing protein n=1 Tax=Mariniphaga anaerophila TaxID=1484053 RepID=A0A831PRK2_9BACT|nr:SIS domain-containing protein [Mariniphaga anaerophila]